MKTNRPASNDWRRQGQEGYLKGAALCLDGYRPCREGWEHDHCEFCWAKFSLDPADLSIGYRTMDGYRWVCERCFEDFLGEFEWVIVSP